MSHNNDNDKEKPAGSQSLFRVLILIEILSNYTN
ncbi:IclR family transcriptional regulator, partial [Salmonella enterica subsp. enterica serovar Infantis]